MTSGLQHLNAVIEQDLLLEVTKDLTVVKKCSSERPS